MNRLQVELQKEVNQLNKEVRKIFGVNTTVSLDRRVGQYTHGIADGVSVHVWQNGEIVHSVHSTVGTTLTTKQIINELRQRK